MIQVGGTSGATFSLASPVQAGAYQYALQRGDQQGLNTNNWYLVSTMTTPPVTPPVTPPTPTPTIPIYRPGVVDYVLGEKINYEQGIMQISTLHQRVGEQKYIDDKERITWLRPYYSYQSHEGKNRFDAKSHTAGMQLGQDMYVEHTKDDLTHRVAFTLDYAYSHGDFKDTMRNLANLNKDTGSLQARSVGVGATYTLMNKEGAYIDIVGQYSSLHNRYHDSYGDKSTQMGQREALSLEVGKPIGKLGEWIIEPQAQLIYMHTHYDRFHDNISMIDGYSVDALRGRLGMRLFNETPKEATKKEQYYGIVNVLHDFKDPKAIYTNNTSID